MHLPDIELHEATTLEEAATLAARHAPDARLLAGGTDLLVDLKASRVNVGHLVSINRVSALRGVSETESGVQIGALTTITELSRSPIVGRRYRALLDATSQMAAHQIRNAATVGGNIASAVPCADLPPILTAPHASIVLWSPAGERELPLEQFFVGARATVRRADEILTAVRVPDPDSGLGAAYARFGLRGGNTIAVAAVAARLSLDADDTVREARVVLGAVAPIPKLVQAAGARLVGRPATDDAFDEAAAIAMHAAEMIDRLRRMRACD